ncbi:MAG TPA: hypothetical protein VF533_19415 [Solirubrobacteraceae bacterium]|jgi:hypothetical protein
MATRVLALLAVVALLALAPLAAPAAAQEDTPFGPVPTETPKPEKAPGEDDVSRTTLYLIAAGVLVAIVGIGYAISRDARRSLTAEDREAVEREERGERLETGPSKQARERARKQRAKVKASRRARRQNR